MIPTAAQRAFKIGKQSSPARKYPPVVRQISSLRLEEVNGTWYVICNGSSPMIATDYEVYLWLAYQAAREGSEEVEQ